MAKKQYLRQRPTGAYFYQRRVPKDLIHRQDVFRAQFIEEYLGTTDRRLAERKVSAVNEKWEQKFDAMRSDSRDDDAKFDKIRQIVQHETFQNLVSQPVEAEDRGFWDLGDLSPENLDDRALHWFGVLGVDPKQENLSRGIQAVWDGKCAGLELFKRGLQPPKPKLDLIRATNSGNIGPTILDAADRYVNSSDVTVAEKTIRQTYRSAELFADHIGRDTPVESIGGKDAVAFLDRLASIDPDYRRHPRAGRMTLSEIAELYPATNSGGLSAATINKHSGAIRILISWLIKRHELPEDHRNPFDRKSRSTRTRRGYLPMTDDEISRLLRDAQLSSKVGKNFASCIGWLVLLGAYTGARAGELCALKSGDIREKEGVPYFAIENGKTENARRVVPMHPRLIELGFLDYAKKCSDGLFGITSKTLSKRFPDYRRGSKVDRAGVTFHSLRKSFVARLEDAAVPSDTAAILVGHKSARSFTYDVYNPHGPTLYRLAEAVGKVKYEGLVVYGE